MQIYNGKGEECKGKIIDDMFKYFVNLLDLSIYTYYTLIFHRWNPYVTVLVTKKSYMIVLIIVISTTATLISNQKLIPMISPNQTLIDSLWHFMDQLQIFTSENDKEKIYYLLC